MNNAISSGQKTHKKTKLDLESNPISIRNDRYVGTIIAQKHVKTVAIINVLQKAWDGFGAVRITEVMDKVVMFQFEDEVIKNQIFHMSPG